MATTELDIAVPPDEVYEVITSPTTFPLWLPGAQHIRGVEPGWPEPGSSFHHRVGAGPLAIRDATTVLDADPPRRFTLRARIGWLGSALVRFTLTEGGAGPDGDRSDMDAGGRDRTTHVVMEEIPEQGLLRNVWNFGGRHLLRLSIWGRNRLALEQLRTHLEQPGTPEPPPIRPDA